MTYPVSTKVRPLSIDAVTACVVVGMVAFYTGLTCGWIGRWFTH